MAEANSLNHPAVTLNQCRVKLSPEGTQIYGKFESLPMAALHSWFTKREWWTCLSIREEALECGRVQREAWACLEPVLQVLRNPVSSSDAPGEMFTQICWPGAWAGLFWVTRWKDLVSQLRLEPHCADRSKCLAHHAMQIRTQLWVCSQDSHWAMGAVPA